MSIYEHIYPVLNTLTQQHMQVHFEYFEFKIYSYRHLLYINTNQKISSFGASG